MQDERLQRGHKTYELQAWAKLAAVRKSSIEIWLHTTQKQGRVYSIQIRKGTSSTDVKKRSLLSEANQIKVEVRILICSAQDAL